MSVVEEVYLPDPQSVELRPFEGRVLDLVRLFRDTPVVHLRIVGTIAGGQPIEANEGPDDFIEVHGPDVVAQRHPAFQAVRHYLCPSLLSVSSDAFEVARLITPLLIGLKLSGKVAIDLDPWLFAGIALIVERMGVAVFCAGYDTDDRDDKVDNGHDQAPAPEHALAPEKRDRDADRGRRRSKARARGRG